MNTRLVGDAARRPQVPLGLRPQIRHPRLELAVQAVLVRGPALNQLYEHDSPFIRIERNCQDRT